MFINTIIQRILAQ